jgi:hypothetical protein
MRLAQSDADAAAAALDAGWSKLLDDEQAALAWASVGRQAAQRLQRARARPLPAGLAAPARPWPPAGWSDDTLAWGVRAALRGARMDRERWAAVLQGDRRHERGRAEGRGLGLLEGARHPRPAHAATPNANTRVPVRAAGRGPGLLRASWPRMSWASPWPCRRPRRR